MPEIISASLNIAKIDKAHIFDGKKGRYLNIALLPNKDGQDQYGNDYMVVQSVSKEARERGERGPILGNAKILKRDGGNQDKPKAAPQQCSDDNDGGEPF
jgi:hypothetical protein